MRLSRKEVEEIGKFDINGLIIRQRQNIFQEKYKILHSKENLFRGESESLSTSYGWHEEAPGI